MQKSQLSPEELPIAKHLPRITTLIEKHPAVVVSGKTGCGKSTQVPKAIWRVDSSVRIAVCQPRRVAATSLAVRVAEQVGCKLGSTVGYHIGMESFHNEKCAIIYMTYGILIQELLFQKDLSYTHIILDEIHQRSLQIDFCFVALKNLLNKKVKQGKKKPKLVVMSATLNSEQFAQYFSADPETGLFFVPEVISLGKGNEEVQVRRRGKKVQEPYKLTQKPKTCIPAECFDIPEESKFNVEEIFWAGQQLYGQTDEQPRLQEGILTEAMGILSRAEREGRAEGDILIFLPGFYQIQQMKRKLLEKGIHEQRIVEVHSIFSEELYSKLFQSKVKNKFIIATNIGQSSITLPFCKVVVDFCLTKKNTLKGKGLSQLETRFASQASMTQRAGRVGRVADGTVYRMITKAVYDKLPQYEEPQIKCITLEMVILRAKQLDSGNQSRAFGNPYQFLMGVMDPPSVEVVRQSIEHLLEEQALIGRGSSIAEGASLELTKIGEFMVSMPCDLQLSKMVMMGIKLRIPSLTVSIASIMMSTKMFFNHEERRQNIEEFMHALIGYDQGCSNDFLLRQRLYQHWKEKFYYPAKQKKLYRKRVQGTGQPEGRKGVGSSRDRIYQNTEEQEQLLCFLQEFTQQKWSEKERQFCFPRGVSLHSMREIVKIQENLRMRLKNMGIVFQQKEHHTENMLLLCLAKAFHSNDCEVIFSKYITSNPQDMHYLQIPSFQNIDLADFEQYISPQREYQLNQKGKRVRVSGSPSALKKFIFPQLFSKTALNKEVSPLFSKLAREKIGNRFECDIAHMHTRVVVLNESINRVLIPPDYSKKYRLLTNQFSVTPSKKLLKCCALIEEDTFLMTQLVTDPTAEVSLHPSRQMLSQFRVGGCLHQFKRIITARDLEVIRRLRAVTIRQKNKDIHSEDEIMSEEEADILNTFLAGKRAQIYRREPWEQMFINSTYGTQKTVFYPIVHPFQFSPEGTYLKAYQSWKRKQYRSYIENYRQLLIDDIHLVCKQCPHLEPIQRITMIDPKASILQLNEYSGSWQVKGEKLVCSEGHQVGQVIIQDEEAFIYQDKLLIYIPCNKPEPFWTGWPTKERLEEMQAEGKRNVARQKERLDEFECPFCFDKDEQGRPLLLVKKNVNDNFWKRLQAHLGSHQHCSAVSEFRKSLRS